MSPPSRSRSPTGARIRPAKREDMRASGHAVPLLVARAFVALALASCTYARAPIRSVTPQPAGVTRASSLAADSTTATSAHRVPLVAGFLGVIPGLGHVYADEPLRGLAVAGVWFGSGMVMFGSRNTNVAGTFAVINIGTYVFSIADAALAAERFNTRHVQK